MRLRGLKSFYGGWGLRGKIGTGRRCIASQPLTTNDGDVRMAKRKFKSTEYWWQHATAPWFAVVNDHECEVLENAPPVNVVSGIGE